MPVVSQSIMKPMVPVGASSEAWALRKPLRAPSLTTCSHSAVAASWIAASMPSKRRRSSLAAWCLRITRWWAVALRG